MCKKLLRRISCLFRYIDPNSDLDFLMEKVFKRQNFGSLSSVSMSGEALSRKLAQTTKSKCVLEFGSGSSTFLFSLSAKRVISIESDKQFASYIEKAINLQGLSSKAQVLYANIGVTKSYGQPIKFLAPFFSHRYSRYTDIVFNNSNFEFRPEIVFIDGRFRVWCALQSCLKIQNDFILIFDDFFSRTEYHVIESLLGPAQKYSGDTAKFEVYKGQVKSQDLERLKTYEKDFR